jgi:hypothetical protein
MHQISEINNHPINVDLYKAYIDKILINKDENAPSYKKTVIETCHVAKFLCKYNTQADLIEKRENPDFLLKEDDLLIGLEHEVLVDQEKKKIEGSVSNLLQIVENEYKAKHPEDKILVNIYCKNNLDYKLSEKQKIVRDLSLIVEKYIASGHLVDNEYIDDILLMKHSGLNFVFNPGAWFQVPLKYNELIKAIHKKEKKIHQYRKNSKTENQWLLIVIGSLGPSSFEIENTGFLTHQVNTEFNRVFILEDFSARLYELL